MASAAPERVDTMTTTRPFVPDSVIDLIGRTPLIRLRAFGQDTPGVELYAKAEFQNPGGSVKDRAVPGGPGSWPGSTPSRREV